MTAGIAANRPIAVANSASEIPGATTASEEFCCIPIWKKLFMIPHTVPNSPTTGSVAPFVGLFGTGWGIMNSFFQIGQQQSSSLAVVAPGISEALFATAIGLFAAIPAVMAYNRFSARVNAFEARLQRFADRVYAQVGRELERT